MAQGPMKVGNRAARHRRGRDSRRTLEVEPLAQPEGVAADASRRSCKLAQPGDATTSGTARES